MDRRRFPLRAPSGAFAPSPASAPRFRRSPEHRLGAWRSSCKPRPARSRAAVARSVPRVARAAPLASGLRDRPDARTNEAAVPDDPGAEGGSSQRRGRSWYRVGPGARGRRPPPSLRPIPETALPVSFARRCDRAFRHRRVRAEQAKDGVRARAVSAPADRSIPASDRRRGPPRRRYRGGGPNRPPRSHDVRSDPKRPRANVEYVGSEPWRTGTCDLFVEARGPML